MEIDVDQLLKYRSFFESASSRTSYENAAIRLSPGTEREQPFTSQVLARDAWKAAKHLSSLSEVSQELKKNLATRAAKSPGMLMQFMYVFMYRIKFVCTYVFLIE